MTQVLIGKERIPVVYVHNIWTDKRAAGVLVGVALVALLAISGIYAVYPLKGLGFSSIGWYMLGGSAIIAVVEVAVIIAWVKKSEPTFHPDKKYFASLDRFHKHEKGFDFLVFPKDRRAFVAIYVQDGASKQFRIFKNNEIVAMFLDNIQETHPWTQPDDLT